MKSISILMASCALMLAAPNNAEEPTLSAPAAEVSAHSEGEASAPLSYEPPAEGAEEDGKSVQDIVGEWFSPERIAIYITDGVYIATALFAFLRWLKAKKEKSTSLTDVLNNLQGVVSASVSEEVGKILPDVLEAQAKTNEILKSFSKILALAQENTPESRLAILEVIEQMGQLSKEVTDKAKGIIEAEKKSVEEKKEKAAEALDEIIGKYDGTSL